MCRNGRELGAGGRVPGSHVQRRTGCWNAEERRPSACRTYIKLPVYCLPSHTVLVNKETTHELNNYYVYIRCLFSVLHTPQSTHYCYCCYCTKVLRYSALIYQFSCLFGNLLFFTILWHIAPPFTDVLISELSWREEKALNSRSSLLVKAVYMHDELLPPLITVRLRGRTYSIIREHLHGLCSLISIITVSFMMIVNPNLFSILCMAANK